MNSISPVFFYSLLPVLLLPSLFPSWHLTFFAPFLVFSYYRRSFLSCLWLSCLCGTIIDVLSAAPYLGIHATNYCVVTGILYHQKQNYFEDSLTTLPILTTFFAILSTLTQAILMYFTNNPIDFSWLWIRSDLIKMSLWDALYAFMWFTVPLSLLSRPSQRRNSFLLP